MKGVSPVIATILLLLITISLIGFVFMYMERSVTTTGEQTEEQLKEQIAKFSKGIWIDNAAAASVVVRNIGSQVVNATEIRLYVNDAAATCSWSSGTIAPSSVATCTLSESCSGKNVKATGPSNDAKKSCA
ncbi:MAG: archaellin/type IV pilin N-terminal domain-containing protein [Candidatus Aenigmatarchaeota archaeon]